MSNRPHAPRDGTAQLPSADLGQAPAKHDPGDEDAAFWHRAVRGALADRSSRSLEIAESGLRASPIDPELLLLAALAATASGQGDRSLALLKLYGKRYVANRPVALLTALALGQPGQHAVALAALRAEKLDTDRAAFAHFVGEEVMADWLFDRLRTIRSLGGAALRKAPARVAAKAVAKPTAKKATTTLQPVGPAPTGPVLPAITGLPKLEARFDMTFEIANPDAIEITGGEPEPLAFRLRGELTRLSLFEGFDELLCLRALLGVEAHWYQVETVRKVLKQYRGRVLLADEVGLGKTVEAGMVLKEYILRGMADRILILTPASLVGQWRDEMAGKFGVKCATSHDPLLRGDPAAFWA